MKAVHLLVVGALVASTGMAEARSRVAPQQRLDTALAGRVAGQPVSCIDPRGIRSTDIIDKVGILYTMNNGTKYLNRVNGAPRLMDEDDILLKKSFGSQLCKVDLIHLLDHNDFYLKGAISLSEFIPYPDPLKTPA